MNSVAAQQRSAPIMAEFSAPIIEADWLAQHRHNPGVRIIDVRDRQSYDTGHVPGAIWLDRTALSRTCPDHSVTLVPAPIFASLISRLGITNTTQVVVYDDVWGMHAARLVWALWRYGHRQAAVLNGGSEQWQLAGLPVTRSVLLPYPQPFSAGPDAALRADMVWLAAHYGDRQLLLLDVRAEHEYLAGHLPGARHWEWSNATASGSWAMLHNAQALRSTLAASGITPERRIVTYCSSQGRAAHTALILRSLGYPEVRVLDDAWRSRASRVTLPSTYLFH